MNNVEPNAATPNDIQGKMEQVLRKYSNKELALIADNEDGSADVLLIRGDSGDVECYWLVLSDGIMSPLLKGLVGKSLSMKEADFSSADGIYPYMATVAGIAACFQANVPGIALREAFFGPLDYAVYQFVIACGGFTRSELTFIKRNRNLAYKYRKACEAMAKKGDMAGDRAEELSDEALADALGLTDDEETLF